MHDYIVEIPTDSQGFLFLNAGPDISVIEIIEQGPQGPQGVAGTGGTGGVGGVTDHGALTGLLDDDHPQYLNVSRGDTRYYTKGAVDASIVSSSTADRARANHTGTQTSATISDFSEAAQDAVAAMLAEGTGVTLSYNDAGNTLTVTSTGTGGVTDPEVVRDTIGTALLGLGVVTVTVNDAADTITISSTATVNSTDAQLRDRTTHTGSQPASTVSDFNTAALAALAGELALRPKTVLVVTGSEARPTGSNVVLWIGGSTAPTNMTGNDVWLSTATAPAGDTTPPGVPTGLSSSAITTTGFTVSWTAPTDNVGVTGYEVRVDGVSYGTPVTTSQAITGRSANTAYSVDVRARDAAGNFGAYSTALSVTTAATADTTPPGVPTALTSSGITSSSFTVSWTAPTDNVGVTGYEVRVGGVSYATPTTTSQTVVGRAASTAYTVDVRARDAAGNFSAYTSPITVTTGAASADHTVFGAAAPPTADVGTLTYYTDGPSQLVSANAFYVTTDGWTCKGGRVWIPAGSAVPANLSIRAYRTQLDQYPDQAMTWDTPTQAKIIASPVAGAWNEVLFDTPFTVNKSTASAPQLVWIGYNWNGIYIHSPGGPGTAVTAKDGAALLLSANPVPGTSGHARAVNRAGGAAGQVYYATDIIATGP